MNDIQSRRCFNHHLREAVARCPECRRFFCRECITEHANRIVCARCLERLVGDSAPARRRVQAGLSLGALAGFCCLWLLFYGLGRLLLALPSTFHEGFTGPAAAETAP